MRSRRTYAQMWRDLLNLLACSVLVPTPLRWRLLRAVGMPVQRSSIGPQCWFGGRKVEIGARTSINYQCFFDALDWIRIGPDCDVAMRVTFATSTHEIGDVRRRGGPSRSAPIVVGAGTWIGAGVTVLPGVTIGPGCIISAGSVVTTDCEPSALYAGNPATLKRRLDG